MFKSKLKLMVALLVLHKKCRNIEDYVISSESDLDSIRDELNFLD